MRKEETLNQKQLQEEIRKRLILLKDTDYKEFNDKLIPGVERTIGIRLPALRALAKEMASGMFSAGSGVACIEALQAADSTQMYYEEIMLQGILIGAAKLSLEERLGYIRAFVPRIDNWAVCDCVSGSLKFITKTEEAKKVVWNLLLEYVEANTDFEIRFGVVTMMGYYLDEQHIDQVLYCMNQITHSGYYVKMGVAWALSVCYVKFPEKTMAFFKSPQCKLDNFTYNKAIQKIRESFRVSTEDKEILNKMKRK